MEELSFTLSQIIGETISSVHSIYNACNKNGLQEFHSFIKLSNGVIIDIPVYDDEVLFVINERNKQYLQDSYNKGDALSDLQRANVEGKVIEDIFFCYDNGLVSEDKRAYLKLTNGYYFTEVNYRPVGVNDIGIILLRQSEFEDRINSKKEEIKSYLRQLR